MKTPRARSWRGPLPFVAAAMALTAFVLFNEAALATFIAGGGVAGNDTTFDVLGPPTALNATGGTTASLSWTATPDTYASGHRVFRGAVSGGPYIQIAEITPRTTTTYIDSPASGAYYYVVRSFFQNWESVNSNQVSAVVSPIVLRNVASVNNGGGSTSLTISKPADVVANDVMLAQITVRGGTGVTITAPSGWAQIRRENSGTTLAQAIYWKQAGASEPASYAWTFSATQKASGGIAAYSGVSTSTPINAHGGQANASSTSVTAPSITPTAAGARLVGFFGAATGTTFTPPGSMTERWDTASTNGSAGTRTTSEGPDQTLGVTGATGTRVATAGATAVNIGQLVALTPQ